jgi:hypothetical protein
MKEYEVKVFGSDPTEESIRKTLNGFAVAGWRPILLAEIRHTPEVAASMTIIFEREKQTSTAS